MNSQEIISLYESIADLTGQMLAAARDGDWERLAGLESHCTGHVATLKSEEPHTALSGIARERKVKIIQKILEDDRAIRSLTQPWTLQLSALMNSNTERNLSKTRGANP